MNINEKWEQWNPIKNLEKKYHIDFVLKDESSFKIILTSTQNNNKKIIIFFEHSVNSFRWTNESYRLETMGKLGEKYENGFYGNWTFFKVNNSEYLKWLSDEALGLMHEREFLKHFSFIGTHSFLDVIASYEPKVELLEEKNTF